MHDLQGKIHMRHPLMDRTGTDNIHIGTNKVPDIRLRQPARDLDQELPLRPLRLPIALRSVFSSPVTLTPFHPPFLQRPSRGLHVVGAEIIEHDDVGARGDGFVCFGEGAAFDFYFDGEAGCGLGGLDGGGDGSGGGGPDVVVF